MKLAVILEPSEEGGYTARVPSLPGCISEGDTRDEALRNIQEAIENDMSYSPDSEITEVIV
ncbi:MAG: type II toxin-antitoxin system HicB family antitoxin [Candidatus Nitrosoglobus sp.]